MSCLWLLVLPRWLILVDHETWKVCRVYGAALAIQHGLVPEANDAGCGVEKSQVVGVTVMNSPATPVGGKRVHKRNGDVGAGTKEFPASSPIGS